MTIGTDAYEQGRLAFRNNHPMSSCDFPVGSTLRQDWMNGWNEARNASPKGDGAEDQTLDRKGDPAARTSGGDAKAAFANR